MSTYKKYNKILQKIQQDLTKITEKDTLISNLLHRRAYATFKK